MDNIDLVFSFVDCRWLSLVYVIAASLSYLIHRKRIINIHDNLVFYSLVTTFIGILLFASDFSVAMARRNFQNIDLPSYKAGIKVGIDSATRDKSHIEFLNQTNNYNKNDIILTAIWLDSLVKDYKKNSTLDTPIILSPDTTIIYKLEEENIIDIVKSNIAWTEEVNYRLKVFRKIKGKTNHIEWLWFFKWFYPMLVVILIGAASGSQLAIIVKNKKSTGE